MPRGEPRAAPLRLGSGQGALASSGASLPHRAGPRAREEGDGDRRLDDRGKAEIEAIDRALGRIANGDYGRCEVCGSSIPLSRLEALPAATTCLRCAEVTERPGL